MFKETACPLSPQVNDEFRGSKLNPSQSKRRDAHLWDKVDKINPEAQYIFSIIKE